MFTQLCMELSCEGLNIRKGSVMQGVMFEQLDPVYAAELHRQSLHPYSQYLTEDHGKFTWTVNTMNDQAKENIIDRLYDDSFKNFHIKDGDLDVQVMNKQCRVLNSEELLEQFYHERGPRSINFAVKTPASFKQNGRYVTLPDLRLIYQSLMNRYGACNGNLQMFDEDTLGQMLHFSMVTRYRLSSVSYSLEGVKIPGFIGNMTVSYYGNDTVARYARMLFRFGEYSGIGIKTAMGMGAMVLGEDKQCRKEQSD